MSRICSIDDCDRPVHEETYAEAEKLGKGEAYENRHEPKCILHCEKDEGVWYDKIPKLPDSFAISWNSKYIDHLLNELRQTRPRNFRKCIFPPLLKRNMIEDNSDEHIMFIQCKFLGRYEHPFDTNNIIVYFHDCTFTDNILFDQVNLRSLYLEKCRFYDMLIIFSAIDDIHLICDCDTISFSICSSRYNALKCKSKKQPIRGFSLSDLNLTGTTEINIRDVSCIELEDITLQNSCLFNISFKTTSLLHLSNVTSYSTRVLISGDLITDHLTMNNLLLQDVIIRGIDSSHADIFLENTILTNTLFSNFNWGDITDTSRISLNRAQASALKHTNDAVGNHIEANKLYTREMIEYRKELFSEFRFDKLQEMIIFLLGDFSSKFGLSWFRPLMWIAGIGLLVTLYSKLVETGTPSYWQVSIDLLYLLPLSMIVPFAVSKKWKQLKWLRKLTPLAPVATLGAYILFRDSYDAKQAFEYFGQSINPFTKFDQNGGLFQYEFSWVVHKAALSFFIYQFIVAVRRLTRR